jgi:hypothetical protein
VYENRTVIPVEIFLRSRCRGVKENDGGANLIAIYYKHVCKHHNASPMYKYYMLILKSKIKNAVSPNTCPSYFADQITYSSLGVSL